MNKTFLVAAALLTLTATPAFAQETHSDKLLTAATITFAVASQSDALTTYYGQNRERWDGKMTVEEVDPIYANMSPAASLAIGGALDTVQALFWTKLVAKHHPRIAAVGLFVSSAVRFQATLHTVEILSNTPGRR